MKVTFKRDWFFGGDHKDENGISDWICGYKASNGMLIEVQTGFNCNSRKWYLVNGKSFDTLKEAKEYVIQSEK
jgi:hypothetical protein